MRFGDEVQVAVRAGYLEGCSDLEVHVDIVCPFADVGQNAEIAEMQTLLGA